MGNGVGPSLMRQEIEQQPAALRATIDALLPRRAEVAALAAQTRQVLFIARGTSDNAAVYGSYLIQAYAGRLATLAAAVDRDHVPEPGRPVRRAGRRPVPVRPYRGDRRDAGLGAGLRRADAGDHQRRRARRWPRRPRSRSSPRPGRSERCRRPRRSPPSSPRWPCSRSASGPRWTPASWQPRPTPSPTSWPVAARSGADRRRAGEGAGRGGVRPRHGLRGRAGAGAEAQGSVLPARDGPVLRRPAARARSRSWTPRRPRSCWPPTPGPTLAGSVDLARRVTGAGARPTASAAAPRSRRPAPGRCPAPALPEWLAPIGLIVPGQLLTEALARSLGLDPDNPRGLTKVTQTD